MFLAGKWIDDQKTENIEIISNNYFKKANDECGKDSPNIKGFVSRACEFTQFPGLFQYARFADDVYERAVAKQRSPEYLMSLKLKAQKKEDEKELRKFQYVSFFFLDLGVIFFFLILIPKTEQSSRQNDQQASVYSLK
jgi:hypothetical protein